MKEKISKIKVLFADVDNTLLRLKMYDQEGKRIIGVLDPEKWLEYNIQNNAYEKCTAPKGMENLVNGLHFGQNTKVYGLTECSNSFEYNAKYNRLAECYPGVFEHHGDLISTESRHKKVMIMNMICERDGYNHDEVMFIDDSHMEVMEAFEAGYFAMHTTEALDIFADPENEILKDLQAKQTIYHLVIDEFQSSQDPVGFQVPPLADLLDDYEEDYDGYDDYDEDIEP